MVEIVLLIFSLVLILASAEMFTNGVEALGSRFSLSQAVVGSVLAAVGTAMPETILPFVAILIHGGSAGKHIGVGAILGAPFMLSTLAFFLIGVSALVCFARKKREFELRVEVHNMKRDLVFFIVMYGSAILIPLVMQGGRTLIAAGLVIGYITYAYMTFRGESGGIIHLEELYFEKWSRSIGRPGRGDAGQGRGAAEAKAHERIYLIVFQVLCALVLIVGGAHVFVKGLETLSQAWGINPLLFALLVAPIATELPEKFNSVTWTLKGRDSLAVGNVTGAMVFQSTFPVSLGLLFTDWTLSGLALCSASLALLSALMILADITIRKKLSPVTVLLGGFFYLVYAAAIIFF